MSFLIGFSFFFLLLFYTIILWAISKLIPQEYIVSLISFMIVGDGIMVALWYFVLGEFIEETRLFRLGIGTAFFAGAFARSLYFMLISQKK
jgi:hypothetical protein